VDPDESAVTVYRLGSAIKWFRESSRATGAIAYTISGAQGDLDLHEVW
jgi:hypothetical protein